MNRTFLKYIGCAFAVLAGVAVVDKVAGAGMNRLRDAVPVTQDIGKGRFAIREVETDVVIVGSSRAAHHYVSTMIADSLGCSVYNVGRDGCFFSDNLCVTNAILDRDSPKMIVLEVANDCLDENAKTNPEAMFPYYWDSQYIKEVIDSDVGWKANVQMLSTLYRYNATSFKTLGYGIKGLIKGEVKDPHYGLSPLPYKERRVPLTVGSIDTEENLFVKSESKSIMLKKLIEKANANNVRMVLVCSPRLYKNTGKDKGCQALASICGETGIRFLDFSQEQSFLEHPEWFNDGTHLNCKGAQSFTELFLASLMQN